MMKTYLSKDVYVLYLESLTLIELKIILRFYEMFNEHGSLYWETTKDLDCFLKDIYKIDKFKHLFEMNEYGEISIKK